MQKIAIGLIASFAVAGLTVPDRRPAMAQESVTLTHEGMQRVKSPKKPSLTARTKSGKNKAAGAAEKDGTTSIRGHDRSRRLSR